MIDMERAILTSYIEFLFIIAQPCCHDVVNIAWWLNLFYLGIGSRNILENIQNFVATHNQQRLVRTQVNRKNLILDVDILLDLKSRAVVLVDAH